MSFLKEDLYISSYQRSKLLSFSHALQETCKAKYFKVVYYSHLLKYFKWSFIHDITFSFPRYLAWRSNEKALIITSIITFSGSFTPPLYSKPSELQPSLWNREHPSSTEVSAHALAWVTYERVSCDSTPHPGNHGQWLSILTEKSLFFSSLEIVHSVLSAGWKTADWKLQKHSALAVPVWLRLWL